MATRNPVFNVKTLEKLAKSTVVEGSQTMTVHGSVNKTGILLVLMALTGAIGWMCADTSLGVIGAIVSILINIVVALILTRKQHLAPTLAPAYALVEGFAIGAISKWSESAYPGVAGNAMILTFSCVAVMLGLYHFRIIRVTERFKSIIFAAIMAIAVTYLADIVMMFFGSSIQFVHSASPLGIGFSVVVVGIAALSLLVDFDMVEKAAEQHAPAYMEWYAGFAVLVTVVWLYLEILRLLGKLLKR